MVLFSACPSMMLLVVQSFMKIFSMVLKSNRADMTFIGKKSKGHNSVKNIGGVTVLVLYTSSDDGLYLYNVS